MKTRVILGVLLLAVLSGCSMLNVLETDKDYARNGFSSDLKNGIDGAIRDEVERRRPNGVSADETEPWQIYWRGRIRTFLEKPLSDIPGYRGPDGRWFVDYIVAERRKTGLPEIKK